MWITSGFISINDDSIANEKTAVKTVYRYSICIDYFIKYTDNGMGLIVLLPGEL
jgi:hypothetical protein